MPIPVRPSRPVLVVSCGPTFPGLESQHAHLQVPLEGEFKDKAEAARAELVEIVADVDEQLAEAFLAEEPISPDALQAAVRRAALALKFVPVFMGRWAWR